MRFSEIKSKIINLARDQEIGVEYRYNCFLCNDTRRRLYIRKEVNKIFAHCFNGGCVLNHKGLVINSSVDLNFVKNYLLGKENLIVKDNRKRFYNLNLSLTIPKQYVNYLLKYLPKNIIDKYNNNGIFSYDIERDRLAVKCVGGYVLRHLKQKPKWLNLGAEYFVAGREHFKDNKTLLLVEDVISAIKASESLSVASLALLGTHLRGKVKSRITQALMDSQAHVYIWLDKDNAGTLASLKIKKELEIYGRCSIIYYKEPKFCSFQEIREQLKEV